MDVNLKPILEYVNEANATCLQREQDAKRAGPLAKFEDPRVDVALYFIAPHRLRPGDVEAMAQLSAYVPVVGACISVYPISILTQHAHVLDRM